MGLKLGKAQLHDAVLPFCKVSKAVIMKLLTTYQNISDGFGVSMNELSEILAMLFDDLQLAPEVVKLCATHLFKLLDTDNNGLVDGMEFLAVMSICSGMKKTEMLEFSLSLYDFNNEAALSFDELVLALKSACSGMTKVHMPQFPSNPQYELKMPSDEQLEAIASQLFSVQSGVDNEHRTKRNEFELSVTQKNIRELTDALLCIPEVCSWLSFFCNFSEVRDIPQYTKSEITDIVWTRLQPINRTESESKVIDWCVHYPHVVATKSLRQQWFGEVSHLIPIAHANTPLPHQLPDIQISAEWVYGYEVQHGRKNVHYTFANDILYNVGKYIVLYTLKSQSQRLFTGHTEAVTTIQLHPQSLLVASGEEGNHPTVLVWDSSSLEVQFQSKGQHTNGISQLCFSPDGELLMIVDNDTLKSLTMVRWKSGHIIYRDTISARAILSTVIMPKDGFAVAGDCNLWFWTKYSEGYCRREGVFIKNKAKEALSCMILSKHADGVVTGSISGKIMSWNGINCTRQVRGHDGPVTVLHFCADGFLSGGKDSRIRMWTSTLEPRFLFDISKFGVETAVKSVALSRDATTILFSTADADIFEISAIDGSDLRGGPIVKSHSFGHINGVDTHPSKMEFATVGSDRTIRVIDMNSKQLLRLAQLDVEGRSIAYSPAGDVIAIGTDNATSGCQFVVLNEETLAMLHSARDSRFPATLIKFSPDGETLAVGCGDGAILLYSVHDDYELVAKCARHNSAIIGLDFSIDGEWLRSNALAEEMFFFNVDDGSFQSNIPSMRDVQWHSFDCLYSWHTKGIHTLENAVEFVSCCSVPRKEEKKLLACGSTLGQVRFYSFPAAVEGAECFRFPAHVDAVADVRFSFDGSSMISVGKYDHSIIQWKFSSNADIDLIDGSDPKSFNPEPDLSFIEFELINGPQLLERFSCRPDPTPVGLLSDAQLDFSDERFCWTNGILDPTSAPAVATDIPQMSLRLQHVYGYDTVGLRNNICYISQHELAYTCSEFGIVFNQSANAQRIFKRHVNRITAFAVSAQSAVIATAELGVQSRVYVWDPVTLKELFTIPELQCISVCCMCFSSDGQYLIVVGNDRFHTISVYHWKLHALVCKFYAGENKVLSVSWVQVDGSCGLLVTGVNYIRFWKNILSRLPICVSPSFMNIGKLQTFLTTISSKDVQIVGTADGSLYVFSGYALRQVIKAHVGAVLSFAISKNSQLLFTGGADGVVRVWDSSFECKRELPLESLSKNHFHAVRALALSPNEDRLLVGTQGGEVIELNLIDQTDIANNSLTIKGHSSALYAMAMHPSSETFASAGDDAILRICDFRTRAVTKTVKLELGCRALAFSNDGRYLALGFGTGRRVKGKVHAREGTVMVVNFETMKTVFDGRDSTFAITAIGYSPDNKLLVVGSEDSVVYVYNAAEGYSLRYTVKHHQAPIRSIDFSLNGYFLQTGDIAEKVFYTVSSTGISIASTDDIKNEKWISCNCPLSWASKGLWLTQPDAAHVSRSFRSHNSEFLMSSNSFGDVMLSPWPAPQRTGFRHIGSLRSVSSLGWSADDAFLFASSSDGCCICQWSVLPAHLICSNSQLSIASGQYEQDQSIATQSVFALSSADPDDSAARLTFTWNAMICEPAGKRLEPLDQLPFKVGTQLVSCVGNVELTALLLVRCDQMVYGLQRSCRHSCIAYNADGAIVYAVGNLGIVFDRNGLIQRRYSQHVKEILTISLSHCRKLAASGDVGESPTLHVWDALTCRSLHVFANFCGRSIVSNSFSLSGSRLVAICGDSWHTLVVFGSQTGSWLDGVLLTTTSVSLSSIQWSLCAEYREFSILCGGADGCVYCFREDNGLLVQTKFKPEPQREQAWLCALESAVYDENLSVSTPVVLLGASDGLLYAITSDNMVLKRVSAHSGKLLSLQRCPVSQVSYDASSLDRLDWIPSDAVSIASLGSDGLLKIWTSSLQIVRQIELFRFLDSPSWMDSILQRPSSLAFCSERRSFCISTVAGSLWELTMGAAAAALVTESHHNSGVSGELHGLAWNRASENEFVTISDDGILKVWNASSTSCIRSQAIKFSSRAVAWSTKGDLIAVGIGSAQADRLSPKDGTVMLFDAASLTLIREERKAKKWVNDIQFSATGEMIAIAAADCKLYIVDKQLKTLLTIDLGTKRQALRVDFSNDSDFVRATFKPNHLVYYDVKHDRVQANPATMKDVSWVSNSCPFTWNSQGILAMDWSASMTAIAVCESRKLQFVGLDDGRILVCSYPFIDATTGKWHEFGRVSSFASRMVVDRQGLYLVALDAISRSIYQWNLPQECASRLDCMNAIAGSR